MHVLSLSQPYQPSPNYQTLKLNPLTLPSLPAPLPSPSPQVGAGA